jgi:cation diffusion facilitator family transporter
MIVDKNKAALNSVFAAIFLTIVKIIIGVLTGSLGILSEALHSTLDLCAAVVTFLAVRVSDKPADSKHHYGHGKIESFSALIETVLLFITCGWIIYEALEKIFFGKNFMLQGIGWGILVMVISIIVDISRVRVLRKAAKAHKSQALEADALHFSSDILSSSVVIAGLIFVWIGDYFKIPILKYADPVAALGVASLIIKVSIKLGKETVDVLLDTAPSGMKEIIENEICKITGVLQIADIRIRPSGAFQYIDINIGVDPNQSHKNVHMIVNEIRSRVFEKVGKCDVVISTFPVNVDGVLDTGINQQLENVISKIPNCTNIHNIHVYKLEGKKKITAHVELKENLTLNESHNLSHEISNMIQTEIKDVDNVNLYFERAEQVVETKDITKLHEGITKNIKNLVNNINADIDCHEIKLYSNKDKVSAFLHCGVHGDFTVDKLEGISNTIKAKLKDHLKCIENIHIHFEPFERK